MLLSSSLTYSSTISPYFGDPPYSPAPSVLSCSIVVAFSYGPASLYGLPGCTIIPVCPSLGGLLLGFRYGCSSSLFLCEMLFNFILKIEMDHYFHFFYFIS